MQRKLHRSVTEILRSVICRPNLSRKVILKSLKNKSPIQGWNRARTEKLYFPDWRSFPTSRPRERLARTPAFLPDRVREAPAFPPEPSSLNSGIAVVAMGCLPAGRLGRSYIQSLRPR